MFNWELPLQRGTEVFPSTRATPVVVRTIIQIPSEGAHTDIPRREIDAAARKIVNDRAGDLRHFAHTQRRLHGLGGLDYSRKYRSFPGVDIEWRFMAGVEYITLTVHPTVPEKVEEGLVLVVLHDTNQITAFDMATIESEEKPAVKYTTTLKHSAWTDKIIRVAQYKFDTVSAGVIFSGVLFGKTAIALSDTHCLTTIKSRLHDGLASSTPSTWTPHINGVGGVYHTSNDRFEITTIDGKDTLTYGGSAGYVSNSAAPFAISAQGAYYYAPTVRSDLIFVAASPHEQSVTGYTDAEIASFASDAERYAGQPQRNHEGYFLPTDQMDAALHALAPWGYLGIWYPETPGFSGYGVYDLAAYTTTLKAVVNNAQVTSGGPVTNHNLSTVPDQTDTWTIANANISNKLPASTYNQTEDGLDILDVAFTDFTAHVETRFRNGVTTQVVGDSLGVPGFLRTFTADVTTTANTSANTTISFRGYTYNAVYRHNQQTVVYYNRRIDGTPPPPGFYVPETWDVASFAVNYNTEVNTITPPGAATDYFIWLLSYPPNLALGDGGYYHAAGGVIHTPFVSDQTYSFVVTDNVNEAHIYKMNDIYKPWFHVSNGKVCLQGFQIHDERSIYRARLVDGAWEKIEFGTLLAEAAKTTVQNIQAVFADVPLSRIKEFT